MKMEFQASNVQLLLRLLSIVLLVSTALIVGLDTEKKMVFSTYEKKATFKVLNALWWLTIIESVAAGYNLLQLSNSFIFGFSKGKIKGFNTKLAWLSLLLDQMVAYVSFAATSAAAQASLIAVTGIPSLQWLKLCNIYTRFCIQIGGGLACGYAASFLMAVVSSISAFSLFRFYSSTEFLVLKSKW